MQQLMKRSPVDIDIHSKRRRLSRSNNNNSEERTNVDEHDRLERETPNGAFLNPIKRLIRNGKINKTRNVPLHRLALNFVFDESVPVNGKHGARILCKRSSALSLLRPERNGELVMSSRSSLVGTAVLTSLGSFVTVEYSDPTVSSYRVPCGSLDAIVDRLRYESIRLRTKPWNHVNENPSCLHNEFYSSQCYTPFNNTQSSVSLLSTPMQSSRVLKIGSSASKKKRDSLNGSTICLEKSNSTALVSSGIPSELPVIEIKEPASASSYVQLKIVSPSSPSSSSIVYLGWARDGSYISSISISQVSSGFHHRRLQSNFPFVLKINIWKLCKEICKNTAIPTWWNEWASYAMRPYAHGSNAPSSIRNYERLVTVMGDQMCFADVGNYLPTILKRVCHTVATVRQREVDGSLSASNHESLSADTCACFQAMEVICEFIAIGFHKKDFIMGLGCEFDRTVMALGALKYFIHDNNSQSLPVTFCFVLGMRRMVLDIVHTLCLSYNISSSSTSESVKSSGGGENNEQQESLKLLLCLARGLMIDLFDLFLVGPSLFTSTNGDTTMTPTLSPAMEAFFHVMLILDWHNVSLLSADSVIYNLKSTTTSVLFNDCERSVALPADLARPRQPPQRTNKKFEINTLYYKTIFDAELDTLLRSKLHYGTPTREDAAEVCWDLLMRLIPIRLLAWRLRSNLFRALDSFEFSVSLESDENCDAVCPSSWPLIRELLIHSALDKTYVLPSPRFIRALANPEHLKNSSGEALHKASVLQIGYACNLLRRCLVITEIWNSGDYVIGSATSNIVDVIFGRDGIVTTVWVMLRKRALDFITYDKVVISPPHFDIFNEKFLLASKGRLSTRPDTKDSAFLLFLRLLTSLLAPLTDAGGDDNERVLRKIVSSLLLNLPRALLISDGTDSNAIAELANYLHLIITLATVCPLSQCETLASRLIELVNFRLCSIGARSKALEGAFAFIAILQNRLMDVSKVTDWVRSCLLLLSHEYDSLETTQSTIERQRLQLSRYSDLINNSLRSVELIVSKPHLVLGEHLLIGEAIGHILQLGKDSFELRSSALRCITSLITAQRRGRLSPLQFPSKSNDIHIKQPTANSGSDSDFDDGLDSAVMAALADSTTNDSDAKSNEERNATADTNTAMLLHQHLFSPLHALIQTRVSVRIAYSSSRHTASSATEVGSGGVPYSLFVQALECAALLAPIIVFHGHRTWDYYVAAFGPHTALTASSKERREMTFRFMARLTEIEPTLINHYSSENATRTKVAFNTTVQGVGAAPFSELDLLLLWFSSMFEWEISVQHDLANVVTSLPTVGIYLSDIGDLQSKSSRLTASQISRYRTNILASFFRRLSVLMSPITSTIITACADILVAQVKLSLRDVPRGLEGDRARDTIVASVSEFIVSCAASLCRSGHLVSLLVSFYITPFDSSVRISLVNVVASLCNAIAVDNDVLPPLIHRIAASAFDPVLPISDTAILLRAFAMAPGSGKGATCSNYNNILGCVTSDAVFMWRAVVIAGIAGTCLITPSINTVVATLATRLIGGIVRQSVNTARRVSPRKQRHALLSAAVHVTVALETFALSICTGAAARTVNESERPDSLTRTSVRLRVRILREVTALLPLYSAAAAACCYHYNDFPAGSKCIDRQCATITIRDVADNIFGKVLVSFTRIVLMITLQSVSCYLGISILEEGIVTMNSATAPSSPLSSAVNLARLVSQLPTPKDISNEAKAINTLVSNAFNNEAVLNIATVKMWTALRSSFSAGRWWLGDNDEKMPVVMDDWSACLSAMFQCLACLANCSTLVLNEFMCHLPVLHGIITGAHNSDRLLWSEYSHLLLVPLRHYVDPSWEKDVELDE